MNTAYEYPTVQSVIQETVFIMARSVELQRYDKYIIPYRHAGQLHRGTISYADLISYIQEGIIRRLSKVNFAHGEPFLKIPINLLQHDRD